jgi:hypothetical protein
LQGSPAPSINTGGLHLADVLGVSGMDLGHGGDVTHVHLTLDYSTAQRGTSATPVDPAMVIHQFSVLSGLGLVLTANSPDPGPPENPLICFLYINVDVIYRLQTGWLDGLFLCRTHCLS